MSGKVSIVGGAGRVGSSTAYALQLGQTCREIILVDTAADAARGEALDLTHGRAGAAGPTVRAGDYEAARGSDIVVVTAGLRRRPDESRLQLMERNSSLFRDIVGNLQAAGCSDDSILLVVTNPVDVLTYLAATELEWEPARTIGLGTMLDTLRFRSLLGERLGLDPRRVEGMILGEHGDSMVPIYSSLRYDGQPIADLSVYSEEVAREVFEEARAAGAEVLRLKGGAGYAVGLAVREVVAAILEGRRQVLPVSTLHATGDFRDVALSLPTRLGPRGVEYVMAPDVTQEEHRGLMESAEVLRGTIARLREGGS